jgi:hypothetical protein
MKEIRMNYAEYEEMINLIKTQQDAIEELKKQSNVILVDERHSHGPMGRFFYSSRIPKIVGNSDKAKQMLKEEFDLLYIQTRNLESRIVERETNQNKKNWSLW